MKKKISMLLVILLVFFAVPVFANGNQNHTCQGNANCVTVDGGGGGSVTNSGNNTANGGTGGSATANGGSATANATGNGGSGGAGGSGGDASNAFTYDEGNSYAYSAPSLSTEKGTEVAQLGSVFGSISFANTEDYVKEVKRVEVIVTLYQIGLIDEVTAKSEIFDILNDLDDASRAKRILGVGPKTRGKHLFNLFGIVATDSWRE